MSWLEQKTGQVVPVPWICIVIFSIHSDASRHHRSRKQNDGKPNDLQPEDDARPLELLVADFWCFILSQGFIPA